jgi:hypothetical protein
MPCQPFTKFQILTNLTNSDTKTNTLWYRHTDTYTQMQVKTETQADATLVSNLAAFFCFCISFLGLVTESVLRTRAAFRGWKVRHSNGNYNLHSRNNFSQIHQKYAFQNKSGGANKANATWITWNLIWKSGQIDISEPVWFYCEVFNQTTFQIPQIPTESCIRKHIIA